MIERVEIPESLLTCAPDPLVPPDADLSTTTGQARAALYVTALWVAGEDCRTKLGAIAELQTGEPASLP